MNITKFSGIIFWSLLTFMNLSTLRCRKNFLIGCWNFLIILFALILCRLMNTWSCSTCSRSKIIVEISCILAQWSLCTLTILILMVNQRVWLLLITLVLSNLFLWFRIINIYTHHSTNLIHIRRLQICLEIAPLLVDIWCFLCLFCSVIILWMFECLLTIHSFLIWITHLKCRVLWWWFFLDCLILEFKFMMISIGLLILFSFYFFNQVINHYSFNTSILRISILCNIIFERKLMTICTLLV